MAVGAAFGRYRVSSVTAAAVCPGYPFTGPEVSTTSKSDPWIWPKSVLYIVVANRGDRDDCRAAP